jgi:hypothetical protein
MTAPLYRRDGIQRDSGPLSWQEAEAIAATLVALGYSARAYNTPRTYGCQVVVTGRHGSGPRFRYVITDAGQLSKALEDLARGETGGSNELEEGA